MVCKNCNHEFDGKFCNNCGQSSDTERFDFKHILQYFNTSVLHFDAGFVYTCFRLITKPGYTIKDFIDGKRVKYTKPFSLIIILVGFYVLLSHFLQYDFLDMHLDNSHADLEFFNINKWISGHYYLAIILAIPFYTVGTYIAFKKLNYSFWEYFIMNAFRAALRLIFLILFLLIAYIFKNYIGFKVISIILSSIDLVFLLWVNLQFFYGQNVLKIILKSLLSYLIFVLLLCSFLLGLFLLHSFLN